MVGGFQTLLLAPRPARASCSSHQTGSPSPSLEAGLGPWNVAELVFLDVPVQAIRGLLASASVLLLDPRSRLDPGEAT
jgi:hypothetical protein